MLKVILRTLTRDRRTLEGVRALGLLSVSAGFWLDFGWTLQLLPRRRQDPSIQKASQSDDKKRPKMMPKIGENRKNGQKSKRNRSKMGSGAISGARERCLSILVTFFGPKSILGVDLRYTPCKHALHIPVESTLALD